MAPREIPSCPVTCKHPLWRWRQRDHSQVVVSTWRRWARLYSYNSLSNNSPQERAEAKVKEKHVLLSYSMWLNKFISSKPDKMSSFSKVMIFHLTVTHECWWLRPLLPRYLPGWLIVPLVELWRVTPCGRQLMFCLSLSPTDYRP